MSDVIVITGAAAVRRPELDAIPDAVRDRAARAERVTQLAFAAAARALEAAGLATAGAAPHPRLGVVLGTTFGCLLTNAAFQRRFAEGGTAAASPRLFAATVSNAAAGELAIAFRLGGPSVTLSAGSAAGLTALVHACDLLRADAADVLLAGGIDADGEVVRRWIAAAGLGAPATADGAALLVLERATHARGRARRPSAVVVGATLGFAPDAPRALPDGLAASGPAAIVDWLGGGEATATVAVRCPSGHVASVSVERAV